MSVQKYYYHVQKNFLFWVRAQILLSTSCEADHLSLSLSIRGKMLVNKDLYTNLVGRHRGEEMVHL